MKVSQCVRLFATPWTVQSMEFSRPEYWIVGGLPLLQGSFPTQGSDPGLPHCRWILYQLSHKGSPVWLIERLKFFQVCVSVYILLYYWWMILGGVKKLYQSIVDLQCCVYFWRYSKVIQLHIYIYSFFLRLFTHISCYRILNTVPCSIQQVLVIKYFIYSGIWIGGDLELFFLICM